MVDCRDCKHREIVNFVRNRNAELLSVYQCKKGNAPKQVLNAVDCICDEYEWRGG